MQKIKTLGELKLSGYKSKSIKEEMRDNLVQVLKSGKSFFSEIKGFEDSVIPQLQTAILSRHNIVFLGLRGQAKTRMARLMINLLDEYIPVVAGSEMNDDPFNPVSFYAREKILHEGDETPITWLHRDERFAEKLATPDVTVSDVIGDIDPIKAASMKLTYADERVIHFGMIPRANRSIFVINELPDLQARIQVSLFNILQEGDIQIRGFKLRMPLDIQFIFTANPEDYTNRGSIVTPLKDRIGSQILTHYPKSIEVAQQITEQEAQIPIEQKQKINCPQIVKDLIEQIAFEARQSEYVDQKSGVSARLTISAYENLFSVAERRMLINSESKVQIRLADLYGIIPSITGKVELVYEGELEGISAVAFTLIGKSVRKLFLNYFPDPERSKKSKKENPYHAILDWFNEGNELDLLNSCSEMEYEKALHAVYGLKDLVEKFVPDAKGNLQTLMMEFSLHGLAEFSQISKKGLERSIRFKDMMSSILNFRGNAADDDEV